MENVEKTSTADGTEQHNNGTETPGKMKKWNKGNCATGNCPGMGMGQGKGMMKNAGNAPTFTDIDTNKDGVISQEEFRVHQTQRMQNKGNCPSGNCP